MFVCRPLVCWTRVVRAIVHATAHARLVVQHFATRPTVAASDCQKHDVTEWCATWCQVVQKAQSLRSATFKPKDAA
eukprot:8549790-Alexandrium_andersonii.AAC.1